MLQEKLSHLLIWDWTVSRAVLFVASDPEPLTDARVTWASSKYRSPHHTWADGDSEPMQAKSVVRNMATTAATALKCWTT